MKGQSIKGFPVVTDQQGMMQYIKNTIVDEVYISLDNEDGNMLVPLVMELEDMGITVHLKLKIMDGFKDFDITYGKIGTVPVVTFANQSFDIRQIAIKKVMDVVGALVGIIIMLVAMVFVAPAIKLESKGPIFFKQRRVGKNGRSFNIYKFRSMYIDAEERKKGLSAQNEMNGLMFKIKDDPRITKVGKFLRKTSIDELPQFINVLQGDMSLVGTRPPTESEFHQYEGHHKRRLSMKPGITGLWQAYGRNTVTDFEEIVEMDLEYIDNWNIGLDIKILLKTIVTVLKVSGQ
jgi:exopolysaccharide biosynthesis polyprenyl glycosylphosphotransferase